MGNDTRNVRYPDWINKAVADFAKKNGFSSDSKAFIWLLTGQLNRYGYYEEEYTEKMIDKPIPESVVAFKTLKKVRNLDKKKEIDIEEKGINPIHNKDRG